MRYLSLVLLVFAVITLVCPASARPVYEAATTVIDMQSHLNGTERVRQDSDLQELAKSQTVIQRSAETLVRLQVTSDPYAVLSTLEVEPVQDSNVLMIRAQAESEDVAKAAADIVAHEFVIYYDEFTGNKSGKPAIRILSPAATGPARSSFRIFGLGLRVFALFGGVGMVGLIIGMMFGSFIARRARSKHPDPT